MSLDSCRTLGARVALWGAVLGLTGLFGPRAEAGEAAPRARWRVAVVDAFYPGDDAFPSAAERSFHLLVNDAFDIDGDRRRDPWYHGDLVRIYLQGRGIEVIPYVVGRPQDTKGQILHQLGRIREQLDVGARIDGLVLSWESSTLLSALELPVCAESRPALKARIREWSRDSDSWRQTYEIILALEDVARRGVEVYTIAGNSGRGAVNTYSFAEGVRVVGDAAPDPDVSWIADNPLVDLVEKASFEVRLIRGEQSRPLGYDIDEDGRPDIPIERVSSWQRDRTRPARESWVVLKGSSFAAPFAMRRHLLATR